MSIAPLPVQPTAALPTFARLYGSTEADFAEVSAQLMHAWILQNGAEVLGAGGLRPSPTHGSELFGGAFAGPLQDEAALTLVAAALAVQPTLYAYAEAHLLPAHVLKDAGLRPISAYTRMSGAVPHLLPVVPGGFRIVPLCDVHSLEDRLAAQECYSDMIGHTLINPEFVQPGAGGCDESLSRLAFNSSGTAVGICRVWREGEEISFTTPGVQPAARASALRRALLLSVCAAARAAGAIRLRVEAWGDTEGERTEDEALGLRVEEFTPIYASVVP